MFYFPALETVTKPGGGSGCTSRCEVLKPCRQCFSCLCSGKAFCSYPRNECFQASDKPTWETALRTHEMRNCNRQLISTPSRPVRFAGGTVNSKRQRKAGSKALFHRSTTPQKVRHLAFSSNFLHDHHPLTYSWVLCVHTMVKHEKRSPAAEAKDIKAALWQQTYKENRQAPWSRYIIYPNSYQGQTWVTILGGIYLLTWKKAPSRTFATPPRMSLVALKLIDLCSCILVALKFIDLTSCVSWSDEGYY